jgi:uncharacterized protein (DUF2132 family)
MTSELNTVSTPPSDLATDTSIVNDVAKVDAKKANTDPLHGLTLAALLERLVEIYGWEELARFINIRCFSNDPSIKSSLSFLRRTPWARKEVEDFYIKFGHAEWQKSQ